MTSQTIYNILYIHITFRLVQRTYEADYIQIAETYPDYCSVENAGNRGGAQILNYGNSCSWKTIVHQFMHKLGNTASH